MQLLLVLVTWGGGHDPDAARGMHRSGAMETTDTTASSSTASSSTESTAKLPRRKRVTRYLREHPGATLLMVAAAGTVAGVEVAAGALLGGAAALLVSKKTGREIREDLRQRARQMLHLGKTAEVAGEASTTSGSPAPTPPSTSESH
jgi:hypothetical protein